MKSFLFNETNDAFNHLTELYDVIWPLSVSVWVTRCQINGMIMENSGLKNSDFAKLFSVGSKLHGVNYTKNFVSKSWEQQKNELSMILLNHTIAIYEGWLDSIVYNYYPIINGRSGRTKAKETNDRILRLQLTETFNSEIAMLLADQSVFLLTNIYPKYRTMKKRDYSKIINFMSCFRVYKEIRNSFMHSNYKVTKRIIDKKTDFESLVHSPGDLNVEELPDFSFIGAEGDKINMPLDSAVYATDIIMKMIASIDSELSKT